MAAGISADFSLGPRGAFPRVVHHLDHDPLDNDIDNLQVMTRAERCIYHLRMMPATHWTPEEEADLLRLRRKGLTIEVIAKRMGEGHFLVA